MFKKNGKNKTCKKMPHFGIQLVPREPFTQHMDKIDYLTPIKKKKCMNYRYM